MKQFHEPNTIPEMNQRLDCIFSRFTNVKMFCKHYEKPDKDLEKYSYFQKRDNDYYSDKIHKDEIHIFKDASGNYQYVIPDGLGWKSFQRDKRGYSLKPWLGWRSSIDLGTIDVECSLMKDKQ